MFEVYNFLSNVSDAIPEIQTNNIVNRRLSDDKGMKVILSILWRGKKFRSQPLPNR